MKLSCADASTLSGAQFLKNLSRALAQPPRQGADDAAGDGAGPATAEGSVVPPLPSVEKALQGMLGRDEATGSTYLKIPMPEAETMNRIVSGLGQLLSGFIGTNRPR